MIFEEDYSAKNFNRPQFKKLIQFVKKNKKNIDYLLVTNWDRFSRNLHEALDMIKFLKKLGVEVNSIQQPIDFDSTDQKMLLSMYLTLPEIENDKNSIRTREGMRRANKEGCWTGKAPFGYDNHRTSEGKSTLKKNKDSVFVEEAYEMFSTGAYTIEGVRKKLAKKGLTLSKQAFNNLLKRRAYAGKIRVKKYKDEEEYHSLGLHETIITDDLFIKVQGIINKKTVQPTKKKLNDNLPLRGHLLCKKCGNKLTGSASRSRNRKRYYYYHCQNGCGERFRSDSVNINFSKYIAKIKIKKEFLDLYRAIFKDVYYKNTDNTKKRLLSINNKIDKMESYLSNAEDKYLRNEIDNEQFCHFNKKYSGQINEFRVEELEIKSIEENQEKYIKYGINLLEDIEKYYSEATIRIKHKLIGSIFPSKLIFSGKIYRTAGENLLISLMSISTKQLQVGRNKKAIKGDGSSSMAPRRVPILELYYHKRNLLY